MRHQLNLTLLQLAELATTSGGSVKRFRKGERIESDTFARLCHVLNLDPLSVQAETEILNPPPVPVITSSSPEDKSQKYKYWENKRFQNPDAFQGRTKELNTLNQWIVKDKCRLITVFGIGGIGKSHVASQVDYGGIGKSTLSSYAGEANSDEFEILIWESFLNPKDFSFVMEDLVIKLSDQKEIPPPTLDERIERFIHYLKQHRCLIVFDNLESILTYRRERPTHQKKQTYIKGYEAFESFLLRVGASEREQDQHQSCIILTSRIVPEKISELYKQKESGPVRVLALQGLSLADGEQFLRNLKNIEAPRKELKRLSRLYDGHPLALEIAAYHIKDKFEGNVSRFLNNKEYASGKFRTLLIKHFRRLSKPERMVLCWLCIVREPMKLEEIKSCIVDPNSYESMLNLLEVMEQTKLPVIKRKDGSRTLQPVLLEFGLEIFVKITLRQLQSQSSSLSMLKSFAMLQATAKENIREAQCTYILDPLLRRVSLSEKQLEEKFLTVLNKLNSDNKYSKNRKKNGSLIDYQAGNLFNLLIALEVPLNGYCFSHLKLRQAYLQEVNLAACDFSSATFKDCVFTKAFGSISSVVFHPETSRRVISLGHTKHEASSWQIDSLTKLKSFRGHTHWVQAVAYSPSGSLIATGSEDKTIRIWNADDGSLLTQIVTPDYPTRKLAFHPHEPTWIATVHHSSLLILKWSEDWTTQKAAIYLEADDDQAAMAILFHPDGKSLFGGYDNGLIRRWNIESEQCVRQWSGHQGGVYALSLDYKQEFLISGGADATVRRWDLRRNDNESRIVGRHDAAVYAVACSPTAKRVASGGGDRILRVWDSQYCKSLQTLVAHRSTIWTTAFSSDGKLMASGSGDQSVRLWETESGECLQNFQGYMNGIWSLAYEPHSQRIAAGTVDGMIHIYDASLKKQLLSLGAGADANSAHAFLVKSLCFSPDGQFLASSSSDATVKWWSVGQQESTARHRRTLVGHRGIVGAVVVSPDGVYLASGSHDADIRLWNIKERTPTLLQGHQGVITGVRFDRTSDELVSVSQDKTVKRWTVKSATAVASWQHQYSIQTFTLYENDLFLANALQGEPDTPLISVMDQQTGDIRYELSVDDDKSLIHAMAISPDGSRLATAGLEWSIKIWDLSTRTCVQVLQGHKNAVQAMTFTDSNHILISGSEDETICRWNLKTGRCEQSVSIPRPYEKMKITNAQFGEEAQKDALLSLGAVEEAEFFDSVD